MNDKSRNPEKENNGLVPFIEFFDRQGWSYQQADDKPVILTGFNGDNGRWQCVAVGNPKDCSLVFMSLLPCKAPASRRTACAELLTRINYNLTHGCFEMDFEDGEIRFRTSVALGEEPPSAETVDHLVFRNLCVVDQLIATVTNVVYGQVSPKAALATPAAEIPATPRFELN